MSIEAEQIDDWIGSEVVDAGDEKLGKVTEVYYRGADPVIVEFSKGLIGKSYYLAGLAGAVVSIKHLRLGAGETVETDGGITAEALAVLSIGDSGLSGSTLDDIESRTARDQRAEAAREAVAHAETLEAEATHRAEEAATAARVAHEAAERSAAADAANRDAQERAVTARKEANELSV